MADSYTGLLGRLKSGEAEKGQIADLMSRLQPVLDDMKEDMGGIPLENPEMVRRLLATKFTESQYNVSVNDGKPPKGETVVRLAYIILGKYPESAFNVEIVHVGNAVNLYFWKVPKGGNRRE